jgi:hypothetical protein
LGSSVVTDFTLERLLRLFTQAPGAFWRHDVDVSLPAAERMARFAELAGVRSTFYLMPRSDTYNLFSCEGERTVATILETGHRLGLHCDYRAGSVTETVARDQRLLEAAYPGVFDNVVSFHMPPACVIWRDYATFENAYASEWEGRYVADSRREFGPDKEALISDEMQVNLHPEYWTTNVREESMCA